MTDYEDICKEFIDALLEEEEKMVQGYQIPPPFRLHPILQQASERGMFWCSLALDYPTGLPDIFYDYIQP